MYEELKLYCKSEGLSEYLRLEARAASQVKSAPAKAKPAAMTDRKDSRPVKRAV